MEYLAPTHICVIEVMSFIKSGSSTREACEKVLKKYSGANWNWLHFWYKNPNLNSKCQSIYRNQLLEILSRGLQNYPILQFLENLNKEIERATVQEIDIQSKKLGFLSLIPLLLFIFPALLVILLAPALRQLMDSL